MLPVTSAGVWGSDVLPVTSAGVWGSDVLPVTSAGVWGSCWPLCLVDRRH